MDFNHALDIVTAELTPKTWTYTDTAGTTLTVIPAGLRADHGHAEVLLHAAKADATGLFENCITTSSTHGAAEVGITTTELPHLIGALTERTSWEHATNTDDALAVHPDALGVALAVAEIHYTDGTPRFEFENVGVHIPEEQRMPLASALRRAYDVARGWEGPA